MRSKQITLEDVELLRETRPTRRCFAEHASVRARAEGQFVVSTLFPSIDRLFERDTKILTNSGPYGPYRYLDNAQEIAKALEWQERHKGLIFLRDMLDCSIALDYNLASAGVYTDLGLAEHNAKTARNKAAVKSLARACVRAIKNVTFFAESDAVCAVPPSPEKEWDLPTEIVELVSERIGKPNVSAAVRFTLKKKSVKAISLEDKWGALRAGKLKIERTIINGKKIILIDDKYQSGTTAQFIAAKLYDAGAMEVNGLFCIKTWRNTDNR